MSPSITVPMDGRYGIYLQTSIGGNFRLIASPVVVVAYAGARFCQN